MALTKPTALISGVKTEIPRTDVIDVTGPLFQSVTYSSGVPTALEFFNSNVFIAANRVARYDFTYAGDLLTVEALKFYDNDGITVLKTYTWVHTYSGVDYVSSALAVT